MGILSGLHPPGFVQKTSVIRLRAFSLEAVDTDPTNIRYCFSPTAISPSPWQGRGFIPIVAFIDWLLRTSLSMLHTSSKCAAQLVVLSRLLQQVSFAADAGAPQGSLR